MPEGPTVLEARTVVVAIGVGIVVTVASSLIPALRAARDPADRGHRRRARGRRPGRSTCGPPSASRSITVGLPVLAYGLTKTRDALNVVDEIWLVAVGALMVFFGVVVMLATFAAPARRRDRTGRPSRSA